MKVYKIIADKKPILCCECPLNVCGIKVENLNCGSMQTVLEDGTGWKIGGRAPDERCLITVLGESGVEK